MKIHFTLAIATKDRLFDLTRLLNSIQSQYRLPDDIIIVDGSEKSVKDDVLSFTSLPIRYFRCVPPSLPKQRNVAIRELLPETDWVGFLDDDLELLPDTLINLEAFIVEKQFREGGIGLSIVNQPIPKAGLFNSLFMLEREQGGKFTRSGYPSSIRVYSQPRQVEWLYGGATFWSKSIFFKYNFDEWFSGTGYMEDVDFSYRVGMEYPLWVSNARCSHFSHPVKIEKEFSIGEWQICSLWYFAKKSRDFSMPLTLWSCVGISLKNLMVFLISLESSRLRRFNGNLFGMVKIVNLKTKVPIAFYK